MKQLFVCLVCALMFAGISCKKSSNRKPDCFLNVITPERGDVYNLYYDEKGRLSKIKFAGKQTIYEYRADSIIATESNSLSFTLRKKYKLNAQGLPVTMRMDINQSGSEWWQFDYTYNGTEMVKSVGTNYYNSVTEKVEYVWTNGNLSGFQYGAHTWKFEYYNDKLHLPGDAFYLQMLTSGNDNNLWQLSGATEIIRNKNLLKRMELTIQGYGTSVTTYEYGFDNDGKIIMIQSSNMNGDPAIRYDHQYRCN